MKILIPLLSAILTWLPLEAHAAKGYFPAEVKDQAWFDLSKYDEPSFMAEGALKGYHARYRLSITGIVCTEYVIRIDERENGAVRGALAKGNRCRGDFSYETESFGVREDQMQELKATIQEAKLWTYFPEIWSSEHGDDICLDGEELNFERLDNSGYRISLANAQCTAPPKLLEVAKEFLLLAHQRDALRILR